MKQKNEAVKDIVLSALFLALGFVLPFFTGQIKEIGDTLLPMHLPVILCGLICGWRYGFSVGLILPFLRSLCFSMPPLYPNAVWMAAELSTYGLVVGLCYSKLKHVFPSLIISMVSGRVAWGITKALLLGVDSFGFSAFVAGAFVDASLGILLQLLLVPIIIKLIERQNIK